MNEWERNVTLLYLENKVADFKKLKSTGCIVLYFIKCFCANTLYVNFSLIFKTWIPVFAVLNIFALTLVPMYTRTHGAFLMGKDQSTVQKSHSCLSQWLKTTRAVFKICFSVSWVLWSHLLARLGQHIGDSASSSFHCPCTKQT